MAKIISLLMEKADIGVLYDYTQGERFYPGKTHDSRRSAREHVAP